MVKWEAILKSWWRFQDGRVVVRRTNGIWNATVSVTIPPITKLPAVRRGAPAQRFRYDENDNVTHETDALGHALQRVFEAAGLETAITDANGNTTTKAYGPMRGWSEASGISLSKVTSTFELRSHAPILFIFILTGILALPNLA